MVYVRSLQAGATCIVLAILAGCGGSGAAVPVQAPAGPAVPAPAVPAPAPAVRSWVDSHTLQQPDSLIAYPASALAADGTGWTVYAEEREQGSVHVMAARAAPGARFGTPVRVSAAGSELGVMSSLRYAHDALSSPEAPRLALDATGGRARAAWAGKDGAVWNASAVGADWSAPQRVDSGPGKASAVALAAAGGRAALAWRYHIDASGETGVALALLGPGGWGAPQPVSRTAAPATLVRLVQDGQGVATVAWIDADGQLRAVRGGAASHAFGPARSHALSLAADGTLVLAWSDGSRVLASRHGKAWGEPELVASNPFGVRLPVLAANAQVAVVAWMRDENADAARARVVASVSRAGGAWSAPQELGALPSALPQVAVFDQGAMVAWNDAARTIKAATLAGSVWSAPATVSGAADCPADFSLAAAAGGDALINWNNRCDTKSSITAVRYR